ncbi:hypothetical protein [Nonomuraea sp. GTA35]|uniref:hypothetical protein n=1 Tax=Nonomuraea sp. GTA35 TaxID=1676746 RepID=UPI0035BEFF00
MLDGGSSCGLAGIADSVAYGLGFPAWIVPVTSWSEPAWLAWLLPILLAQARDPRFSRATVWLGPRSAARPGAGPMVAAARAGRRAAAAPGGRQPRPRHAVLARAQGRDRALRA